MREDRRPVQPAQPVEVLRDGRWWPARLRCWLRYDETGWRGMCHWTDDQHLKYELWVKADAIRTAR